MPRADPPATVPTIDPRQVATFVAEREAREAFLRKPMAEWTAAEWAEFHAYETEARTWTRSW